MVSILFLAHLGDDFGGFRMITAENDRLGIAFFDFLNDGAVVHGTGGDAFIKDHFGPGIFFQECFGELGQAFAVIALVVKDGNFFHFEDVQRKVHFQAGLGIVGSDGAEKVGVVAALGQRGLVADGDMTGMLESL
jgi:hypothetical protein